MARPSSWIRHVESFVDSSTSSEQQKSNASAIAELVKDGSLTINELVKELDLYLTTTDNAIRSRGILLLAEILTLLASKSLDNSIIHYLIGFFSSRLADWQALHGALVGCLALLRRKKGVGQVAGTDAKILAQSFLENVQVQSLALHDRKLCFELYRCLFDVHQKNISTLGEDIVHGICAAIDQEKDPQCLMDVFYIVKALAELYPDPSGPVAEYAGELFEFLSCYFPVYFTHEDDGVLREKLSEALMAAFSASPFFEEFVIPLLLDKLSSSLHLAKLDSLKYLKSCMKSYGANKMLKHARVLWLSLKDTIFHFPLENSFILSMTTEENSHPLQIADEAIACLRAAISLFCLSGDESFENLIINDYDLDIEENEEKIFAITNILSELVKSSSSCCDKVMRKYFTKLMNTLKIYSDDLDLSSRMEYDENLNFGVLFLAVELLSSCRGLTVPAIDTEWCSLLQKFSVPLVRSFSFQLRSSILGHKSLHVRDVSVLVKGLQILATFSKPIIAPKSIFEDILANIMAVIMQTHEESMWKSALEALSQINLFLGSTNDTDRRMSYETIVFEKILSLLSSDDLVMPLKSRLDAINLVGSTDEEFMLRVIQELEHAIFSQFIKNHVDLFEIENRQSYIQLLNFYSEQILLWCKRSEHFDEVGMRFIARVWKQIEVDENFQMCLICKEISDTLMMVIKSIVSGCSVENQTLIIKNTYTILSSKKLLSHEQLTFSSIRESLSLIPDFSQLPRHHAILVPLSASVIIALDPKTPIPDSTMMIRFLMLHLLRGCELSAQALASLINKWSSHRSTELNLTTLDNVLDFILDHGFLELRSLDFNDTPILINGLKGLAWIGKGLLMRGHEKTERVTSLLLQAISAEENISVEGQFREKNISVGRCAADAFAVLLCDSEKCLNKRFYATVRPLYKQRFFSAVLPSLLSLIGNCKSEISRANFYRAFSHIISNTPLPAVLNESMKIISFMLEALSTLSLENLNKDLVYSLLLVLSGTITSDHGKQASVENAPSIINCLLRLVSYPHMMLVRETSVQCLMAMSTLPHSRIYPFRPLVLRAMSQVLSDIKRPVRLEAVRCRHAWHSMISTDFHR